MFNTPHNQQRKFIASVIIGAVVLFIFNTFQQAYSQTKKKNEIKKEESFNRPVVNNPVKPQIPTVNRYQSDKVFLEYADSLYRMRPRNLFDTVERQILMGNVKFRQGGMWMYCDSAYYYPEDNSLDAFSNVRMEQGDTLFVYADKVFYNGNSKIAYLKNGPTRDKVKLINRNVTLTSDSVDYDLAQDIGWYSRWGTIDDKVNTLTSLYGEYSPRTKQAEFYNDVVLVNKKDGYTMLTDTLHYNTQTHIADIDTRTEIRSENDTIITTRARYYTDTKNADLLSRSLILHTDSAGNVSTLEGDSIIYDNTTRISRVFMFRDPLKRSFPMVLTDTAQKTTLIGGYGEYNDRTKESLATIYPLLIEYSQGDSIFLRADTIKTFTYIVNIPVYKFNLKTKSGYPESNGVPIVMIDTLTHQIWLDTTFFVVKPLLYKEIYNELQAKNSSRNEDEIILADKLPQDSIGDEVILSADSIFSLASTIEGDSIPLDTLLAQDSLIKEDVPDSIPKEFHIAYAYHRGRIFKQDLQGVADSLVLIEQDSILYMFRKPIIWSGERQVTGNRINVHFKDSTVDWAFLPESGLISELVDEDFYNQITGKEIMAYFEGETLRHMNVSGNVETIFLPQESDSTFNRLVAAESSYLDVFLKDNKMERLKMWPEVNGTVTPIFLIKQNQKYLQRFRWWGKLRPQREWYGDRWHWVDNLGEIPDELEQYFLSPSDFGEPKSFPGKRGYSVPSQMAIAITEEIPDSLSTPTDTLLDENSPAIEETEKTLTGEGIEENMEEMNEEKEKVEQQSEEIEDEIKEAIRDGELPQEEPIEEDIVSKEESALPEDSEIEDDDYDQSDISEEEDEYDNDEEAEPTDSDEQTIVTLDDLEDE